MGHKLHLGRKPAVVVATHPRSGTHLTMDLLRRNFPALASRKKLLEPLDHLYVPIDPIAKESEEHVDRTYKLLSRHSYPLIKTHWLEPDYSNLAAYHPEVAEWLHVHGKVIYVVRHPDNVMASHFLFLQGFAPFDGDLAGWLAQKSLYWKHHVEKWTAREDVLVLRFEDIIKHPVQALETVAQSLSLDLRVQTPVLPPRLRSVWHGRFRRVCCTGSPSSEIMTRGQGRKFNDIFQGVDLSEYKVNIHNLSKRFGYETS